MRALARRPRISLLLAALIATGTVVAIAASDSPRALWRAFERMQPTWLLLALGFELLAYAGYVVAYRATVVPHGRKPLSLRLTVSLVMTGFGPFVPLGGFSFDRRALRAVQRSEREVTRQVLGLGVIEYLLLAPAACICALVLLLEHRASPALTLPWVLTVPSGLALGWWATQPRIIRKLQRSRGRARRWLGEVLSGVGIMRGIMERPLERAPAVLGIAVYWAAEIACLAFALRCFDVHISVAALVVAYATGYAASRRSLPLGGAGVTEALLTVALIAVHVPAAQALWSVVAYRVVNFLAPMLPALLAHSSLQGLLRQARGQDVPA